MPGGVAHWEENLQGRPLSSLCGFILAYIRCPAHIKRPFLPFKRDDGLSVCPTGRWVGVYYSRELAFAERLGYEIVPLKGYLYTEIASPFRSYIGDLYEKRRVAKENKDAGLSFIYKGLMNHLYGRFGISAESETCELVQTHSLRYNEIHANGKVVRIDDLNDYYSLITHRVDANETRPYQSISAIAIAAAITAEARIFMYPYISLDACLYTDTDGIVLNCPLPEELVSSSELGKFKLESKIREAFFLAAKSYAFIPEEGGEVVRQKGLANSHVNFREGGGKQRIFAIGNYINHRLGNFSI